MRKIINLILQVVECIIFISMCREVDFEGVYIIGTIFVILLSFVYISINYNMLTISINQMYTLIKSKDKKKIIKNNTNTILLQTQCISIIGLPIILIYFFKFNGFSLAIYFIFMHIIILMSFSYLSNYVYRILSSIIELYLYIFIALLTLSTAVSFDFFAEFLDFYDSVYLIIVIEILILIYLVLVMNKNELNVPSIAEVEEDNDDQ